MGEVWSFKEFKMANIYLVIDTITESVFQQVCSFIHKENVLLKIIARNPLVCLLFDCAYLIRLCKPTIWPLPLQSICKYSNAHNFYVFSTDLNETGIKIHGFLISFI